VDAMRTRWAMAAGLALGLSGCVPSPAPLEGTIHLRDAEARYVHPEGTPFGWHVTPVGPVTEDRHTDLAAGGYIYDGPFTGRIDETSPRGSVVGGDWLFPVGDVDEDGRADLVSEERLLLGPIQGGIELQSGMPLGSLAPEGSWLRRAVPSLSPFASAPMWLEWNTLGDPATRGSLVGVEGSEVVTLAHVIPPPSFGGSLVAGGDLNGDGEGDLLLHDPGEPPTVHLSPWGGDHFLDSADFPIEGTSPEGCRAGQPVPGGDVDGDGVGDLLLVMSPDWSARCEDGDVRLLLGPLSPGASVGDAAAIWTLGGEEAPAPSFVGDLDGDGRDEVALSTRDADAWGEQSGRVLLYYAPEGSLGADDAHAVFVGEPLEHAGAWARSAGDTDGDGRDDLLINALGNELDSPPLLASDSLFLGGRR